MIACQAGNSKLAAAGGDAVLFLTVGSSKTDGYLIMLLHAHLPYIRYPEHERHLEETWLYEAIIESYIPLLSMIEDLLHDRTDFRLTLSLTPTLLEMFNDSLLMGRFSRYLENRIELAEKEVFRTRSEPRLKLLSDMYLERFQRTRRFFEDSCRKDLISRFRSAADSGRVELITSAATHAYLPLHMTEPSAIRAQIMTGADLYGKRFGIRPSGIWLPECGYAPGLEEYLREAGIRYFFLESHGLLNSIPKPAHSIYRPVTTPAGVAAFGRDTESSRQVWSSVEGYPGDSDYRDFYRDIGFDLDYDYLEPYLYGGSRTFTGMKYFRVTGKTDNKELYDPEKGLRKAALHAGHFVQERDRQVQTLRQKLGIKPVITAAYDAELFGHWWHEGPEWLRFILRNPSIRRRRFRFVTPSEYLAENSAAETVIPSASSWGRSGYSSVWLDRSNSWIYRHLKKACSEMKTLCLEHHNATGPMRLALNQALRELLLSQSSDWAFMMKTGNAAEFAEEKFREHISAFFSICGDIRRGRINKERLSALEKKNRIFRDIDFRVFAQNTPAERMKRPAAAG